MTDDPDLVKDPRDPFNWDPETKDNNVCPICTRPLCSECRECHTWTCEARAPRCDIGAAGAD